jgi:hypothetical protein
VDTAGCGLCDLIPGSQKEMWAHIMQASVTLWQGRWCRKSMWNTWGPAQHPQLGVGSNAAAWSGTKGAFMGHEHG